VWTMSEFNAEEILRRLRQGEAATPAAMRSSIISAPSTAAQVNTAPRASLAPAPRSSILLTAGVSPLSPSPEKQQQQQQQQQQKLTETVQAPSSSSLLTTPLLRKEHLDIRATLEQENLHLREELKKARAEIKSLKASHEAISNDFRSYKAKKEGLLAKNLGIIAQLTEKLNALTDERGPTKAYTNSKPLSRPSPFKQTPNTSRYLDKNESSKKQDKLNEDMREKLEAMSAAGSSAPFARPTWSEVMRRITPLEQDFVRSFRSSSAATPVSQQQHHSSTARPSSASSSMPNGYHGDSAPSSPTHHHHHHSQYQHQSHQHFHHMHAQHSFHAPSMHSSHSRDTFFKDRMPGVDDDDAPVVDIDLSNR